MVKTLRDLSEETQIAYLIAALVLVMNNVLNVGTRLCLVLLPPSCKRQYVRPLCYSDPLR